MMKIVAFSLFGFLVIGVPVGCQTNTVCSGGACLAGYVRAPNSCSCVPAVDAGTDADTAGGGGSGGAVDGTDGGGGGGAAGTGGAAGDGRGAASAGPS
jgi:hypothetical protein